MDGLKNLFYYFFRNIILFMTDHHRLVCNGGGDAKRMMGLRNNTSHCLISWNSSKCDQAATRVQRKSLSTVIKVHNNCNLHSARNNRKHRENDLKVAWYEIYNFNSIILLMFFEAKGSTREAETNRRLTLSQGVVTSRKPRHQPLVDSNPFTSLINFQRFFLIHDASFYS